jgi:epoxyqueuosine reductase
MASIQQQIRDAARRLGFALCGFARIEPVAHADFVRDWLAAGYGAGMAYLGRGLAKRLDPRLILPQARSVITVGSRYLPPPLPPLEWRAALRGRIAAYALDTDYHRIVRRQLDALAAAVAALHPAALALAYVDTGAILEREWAAHGAVGWFGKNTNILHTDAGSYFFLGELLTNLEVEPEALVPDHCGTCTRCLDQCPTQALRPGYVLDARLCISYLTIEHRGPIPVELRPQLGNWIFGCDVCQEVCPWNDKLVKREGVPASRALLPYLPDLLRLDADGFAARFAGSAIRRAKRDGFVRNVAVALGNSHNPAAVSPLRDALEHDPSSLVRTHVAWALGEIGGRDARRALEAGAGREADADVRAAIARAHERS